MDGEAGVEVDNKDWAMIAVGGALAVVLGWIGYSETGDVITPEVQEEAQFGGLGIDIGERVNLGTNGAIDPNLHFWHPGYDPVPGAQKTITSRVRYPYVSGGNASTLMHHGFDAMRLGSPAGSCADDFRKHPPSEVNL